MYNKIILFFVSLSILGCSGGYRPLDPDNPDEYFEYWCDPENSKGFISSDDSEAKNSIYYQFHADGIYKSKDECLEYYYFGTSSNSSIKSKQLDDGLEEQAREKYERDRAK